MIRDIAINVELETSYLRIKTDSLQGRGDKISVTFLDEDSSYAGAINIHFEMNLNNRTTFNLPNCMRYYRYIQSSIPTEQHKVWTFEKRGRRIKVYCNGKKVIEVTASPELCDDPEILNSWATYYDRDVHVIKFLVPHDSASDSFFIGNFRLREAAKFKFIS